MKQLKKPIDKKLPRSRLFISDLRSIYTILKNHYERVVFETSNYEITDFDRLKELEANEIYELTVHCYKVNGLLSEATIYFRNSFSNVTMREDTTLNRGILAEIEQVLASRKQRIASIVSNYLVSSCLVGIGIGIVLWLTAVKASNIWSIAILPLAIAFYTYSLWLMTHKHSIIILYERNERPSFFIRNKDLILVGIITAFITALLTLLVTTLITKLAG